MTAARPRSLAFLARRTARHAAHHALGHASSRAAAAAAVAAVRARARRQPGRHRHARAHPRRRRTARRPAERHGAGGPGAGSTRQTPQSHLKRGSFLPTLYGVGQETELVENSAAAAAVPALPPGSPFNFNTFLPPAGVDFPPIKSVDLRGYAYDTLFSFGAIQRYRQARTAERPPNHRGVQRGRECRGHRCSRLSGGAAGECRVGRPTRRFVAGGGSPQHRSPAARGRRRALRSTSPARRPQLASTRAQLIAARSDRDRAQLDLCAPLASHSTPTSSSPIPCTACRSATRCRANPTRSTSPCGIGPDLRALDEQLTAAQQQVSAIRAERLPSLDVFGNKGVQGGNYVRLLPVYTLGDRRHSPGVRWSAPRSPHRRAAGGHEQIQVQRRDLRQQAAIDVRRAFLDLASSRQQLGRRRRAASTDRNRNSASRASVSEPASPATRTSSPHLSTSTAPGRCRSTRSPTIRRHAFARASDRHGHGIAVKTVIPGAPARRPHA